MKFEIGKLYKDDMEIYMFIGFTPDEHGLIIHIENSHAYGYTYSNNVREIHFRNLNKFNPVEYDPRSR